MNSDSHITQSSETTSSPRQSRKRGPKSHTSAVPAVISSTAELTPTKFGPKKREVIIPGILVDTVGSTEYIIEPLTILVTSESKLSPQVVEIIEGGIRAGLTIQKSCDLAGVSTDSYSRWREDYPALEQRFIRIERLEEMKTLRLLDEKVAQGNRCWTGVAWKLERRYDWIPKTETKTTTHVNLTIAKQMFAKMGAAGEVHFREPKQIGPSGDIPGAPAG